MSDQSHKYTSSGQLIVNVQYLTEKREIMSGLARYLEPGTVRSGSYGAGRTVNSQCECFIGRLSTQVSSHCDSQVLWEADVNMRSYVTEIFWGGVSEGWKGKEQELVGRCFRHDASLGPVKAERRGRICSESLRRQCISERVLTRLMGMSLNHAWLEESSLDTSSHGPALVAPIGWGQQGKVWPQDQHRGESTEWQPEESASINIC